MDITKETTQSSNEISEMSAIQWLRNLDISDEDKKILFGIIKEIVVSSQTAVSDAILSIIFKDEKSHNKEICDNIIHQWIANYTVKTIDELCANTLKKED